MNTMPKSDLPRTQALILAGGRGERLLPLTLTRPKPVIPFGGHFRIVDFTLSNCLNSNLDQVALLTQYRHDDLHGYLRQSWSELWNMPGQSARELICLPPVSGKRYRGTADAVFQNLSLIRSNGSECVLILSGDHVYQMDYRELLAQHIRTNADVTIAAVEHPLKQAVHFGIVEVDSDFRVSTFQEKPSKPRALPLRPDMALVSMGVYAFKRDVLIQSLIENCDNAFGFDFGHHVIPSLIPTRRVYAYDFRDEIKDSPCYWRDIGTIDSYYDASMDLAQSRAGSNSRAQKGCSSRPPLPLQSGARVCGNAHVSRSILSPGVVIEEGASVEDSVLMPGARVGPGARIRRAIIEENVRVPQGFEAGCDVEKDRTHHTVSPARVVVVSGAPKIVKSYLESSAGERTVVGLKPAKRGERQRVVA